MPNTGQERSNDHSSELFFLVFDVLSPSNLITWDDLSFGNTLFDSCLAFRNSTAGMSLPKFDNEGDCSNSRQFVRDFQKPMNIIRKTMKNKLESTHNPSSSLGSA